MKVRSVIVLILFALVFAGCPSADGPVETLPVPPGPPPVVEMVPISGGTFTMGSSSSAAHSYPQHQVTVSSFSMGKYQVTQEEYQAVMGTNPSSFKTATNGENPARRPVERVSWYDAVEFCNRLSEMEGLAPYYIINKNTRDPNNTSSYDKYKWLVTPNPFADGYRLPTEAQWEYALAGMPTVYDTGATISGDTGWYWHNSGKKTHEVGLKPANAWGLHDMHGNVWEWCWDWYGSYSSEAQSDPVGPASGFQRVSRGESWEFDGKTYVMAWRYSPPNSRVSDHGFRLVRP